MTYRQFKKWTDDRSCDGLWGFTHACAAVGLLSAMREQGFWSRRRWWKTFGEPSAEAIVADVEKIWKKMEEANVKEEGKG